MFNFERLAVWNRAVTYASTVYAHSRSFPPEEKWGLTSQLRRAAVSVAANIAEGAARPPADFCRFLQFATGSLYEVLTHAAIARNEDLLSAAAYEQLYAEGEEISRMLSGLRKALGE
jgi:four helix bundle protein